MTGKMPCGCEWPSYVPPAKRVSATERAARIIETAQIFHCWGDKEINGLDVQKRLAAAIRQLKAE